MESFLVSGDLSGNIGPLRMVSQRPSHHPWLFSWLTVVSSPVSHFITSPYPLLLLEWSPRLRRSFSRSFLLVNSFFASTLFPLLSRQVGESHFWNLAPTASRRLPEGLVPSRLFPPLLSPSHPLSHACPSFGFGLGLDRMGWRRTAAPSRRLFVHLSLPDWPGRWVNSCVGTKATMLAL